MTVNFVYSGINSVQLVFMPGSKCLAAFRCLILTEFAL